MAQELQVNAKFPPKLAPLFEPHRYKVLWGGRGGGKSWAIARAIILRMVQQPTRVLCVREQMNSIKDSVHRLLSDQIEILGLGSLFEVQQATIKCISGPGAGSEVSFEGIRHNIQKIKSYEGIDICWPEEAVNMSRQSWQVLIPTIRKEGSEIWASFNPELETDETYRRFVLNPPPDAWVCEIHYDDNPWCPASIIAEAEYLKETDYDSYLHVYRGKCKVVLEGAVYADELREASAAGRIGKVEYDPTVGVHLVLDIGWRDATAIWFMQYVSREARYIDYYEATRTTIEDDMKAAQARGYFLDTVWLPHDAFAKTKGGGGVTIAQRVLKLGLRVRRIPSLKVSSGINLARTIFPSAYFDQEKTADGLQALRHYRYELVEDPIKKIFTKEPVHDWTSHAADAFRYSVIALQQPHSRRTRASRVEIEDDDPEESFWERLKSGASAATGWMS